MSRRALIRCDAGRDIGLGHVVRCRALGQALASLGFEVAFAMARGAEFVPDFRVVDPDLPPTSEPLPDVLIVDTRDNVVSREDLAAFQGLKVVIDSPDDYRLAADLAFYPPVPQVDRLEWRGSKAEVHSGWEWIILRPEFAEQGAHPAFRSTPRILISMGGSDPFGLTRRVVDVLSASAPELEMTVLVGPANTDSLPQAPRIRVVRGSNDVSGLMQEADLAVVSFGMTAFELAAVGMPGVYLCISDDHAESAGALAAAGAGVSLGHYAAVSDKDLAHTVTRLCQDPTALGRMSRTARGLIDGRGAARIATMIAERLG